MPRYMSSNNATGASPDILKINTAAGVTEAWLKMQESPLVNTALFPNYKAMLPDMNKLTASILTDATMERMVELTKRMTSTAALNFPTEHLDTMHKLTAQATGLERIAKQINDNHVAISKMIDPSFSALKLMGYDDRLRKSIAAMTSSFATTIDTAHIHEILASASALREELADEDLEEIDDFFETHPDHAETIEELPALYALSKSDRALLVWFVRICVTMSVACIMLNIDAELPELQRVIDALGLGGGWAAGKKAAELTDKALDKLPQEESD
jgi:hypothetical protein